MTLPAIAPVPVAAVRPDPCRPDCPQSVQLHRPGQHQCQACVMPELRQPGGNFDTFSSGHQGKLLIHNAHEAGTRIAPSNVKAQGECLGFSTLLLW